MNKNSFVAFGFFYLVFLTHSIAAEHTTHVHGLAEMTVAIENNRVEIAIELPAINAIGFEHKATSLSEVAAVKKAQLLLSHHENLFSFTGGHCQLIDKSLDLSGIKKAHRQEKSHMKGHAKSHVKTADNENNHSELVAQYYYHCEKTPELTAITVALFDQFSGLQKIYVMWITQAQQGATTLSATNKVIRLRVDHE